MAEAFYNGELENELRRIKLVEYRMNDSDRESCMEEIEQIRPVRTSIRILILNVLQSAKPEVHECLYCHYCAMYL